MHWEQNDDDESNVVPDAVNACEDVGSFNMCGLMDVSVFETTRLGPGPGSEDPHRPRRQKCAC